jgi:hypothetical protein
MTYAAGQCIDDRWTVPVELSGSDFEELWLACSADDIEEATAALKRLSHSRPEITFDHLHRMFFSACDCYDMDKCKSAVKNLVRDGLIPGVETADHAEIALVFYVRTHYLSLKTLEAIALTNRIKCRSKTLALIKMTRNMKWHEKHFVDWFARCEMPMRELVVRRLIENNDTLTAQRLLPRLTIPGTLEVPFLVNYYIQMTLT